MCKMTQRPSYTKMLYQVPNSLPEISSANAVCVFFILFFILIICKYVLKHKCMRIQKNKEIRQLFHVCSYFTVFISAQNFGLI